MPEELDEMHLTHELKTKLWPKLREFFMLRKPLEACSCKSSHFELHRFLVLAYEVNFVETARFISQKIRRTVKRLQFRMESCTRPFFKETKQNLKLRLSRFEIIMIRYQSDVSFNKKKKIIGLHPTSSKSQIKTFRSSLSARQTRGCGSHSNAAGGDTTTADYYSSSDIPCN